jgi:plasmid replication initiation protein
MKKQEQGVVIEEIQQDPNKIIISNPLAVLKFNKQNGRGFAPVSTQEIGVFVPKIVWETVSLLSNTDFENIKGDSITKRIYIRDFIKRIRGDEKNYKYVIDAARILRFWEIASVNDRGQEVYRGFFNDVTHDKKTGYIDFSISTEWARELLDIAKNGNVSFLKQYLFDLQNSHAINLYPTLKAHVYKGKYSDGLDEFKLRFGYNTSGYRFFNNLKARVIEPAIEEINKKSDLIVYFEPEGTNLDGSKPRVTGVIFWVKEKPKEKPQNKPKQQDEPSHISHKIKDIPFVEVKEQPQTIATPPPTVSSVPSMATIQALGEKLKLTIEQVNEITAHYNHDSVRVWEVLQATTKQEGVKSAMGYIIGSHGLGAGLWNEQQRKVKQTKEKELQKLIEKLQDDYSIFKNKQFEDLYNEATEAEKVACFDVIKSEPKYLYKDLAGDIRNSAINDKTGELNYQGVIKAGEIVAELKQVGIIYRQNRFTNYVFEKYNIQIRFNDDKVIY